MAPQSSSNRSEKRAHIVERTLPPVIPDGPRIKSGGAAGEQRSDPGPRRSDVRLAWKGPG